MPTPHEILQKYWGYDDFRPMQLDIITAALAGTDTLALLPTGGGKSLCFQVPALCRDGICVVVSPLIALMKDQVHNLNARGIAAVAVHSGMRHQDLDRILDNCVFGDIKFLYLSPERLGTELVQARLQRMNVNLLAIDEAHCISQWGYDFRPPYLKIAEIRTILHQTPVLALTATATPEVVIDIQDRLGFRKKNVFQQSFVRSNLSYVVQITENKLDKMLDILQKVTGTSVVYARNRKQTQDTAVWLRNKGIAAAYYHAGLPPEERGRIQDDWIANRSRVIVATNAFGMGIDKPDVRTVIHLELPDSLEAYFQEAGRAGRDGQRAYGILLYANADFDKLKWQFEKSYPPVSEVRRVYQALCNYWQLATGSGKDQTYDLDLSAFANRYEMDVLHVYNCVKLMEAAGYVLFSEASFQPATVQIIVNKEEWYNYLLRNKKLESLLKILLRAHDNIWQQAVGVNEFKLAEFLKMPKDNLVQQLLFLQQEGIIEYHARQELPQLTFLRKRVNIVDLDLTEALYSFRKKRHEDKINAAAAYANNENECRTLQLIRYFGEANTKKCGICDVCIAQRKALKKHTEYEIIQYRIQEVVQRDHVDINFLVQHFSSTQTEYVLEIIEFLLDEGKMKENNDGVFCWVKE